jgi:SAM-dependent methyltransferase
LSLDPRELKNVYRRQDAWFAGERGRLLGEAAIGRARRVLDLGCGTCETLPELDRRAGSPAVGRDCDIEVLRLGAGRRVCAGARRLPFADGAFDLVFAQMFFMWALDEEVLAEVSRVLSPGGHLVAAAEPDYGGAIEHPAGSADIAGLAERLSAEGADVRAARRLCGFLQRAGFEVSCGLHPCDPIGSARGEGGLATPELTEPRGAAEFLFVPYFWFLARRA